MKEPRRISANESCSIAENERCKQKESPTSGGCLYTSKCLQRKTRVRDQAANSRRPPQQLVAISSHQLNQPHIQRDLLNQAGQRLTRFTVERGAACQNDHDKCWPKHRDDLARLRKGAQLVTILAMLRAEQSRPRDRSARSDIWRVRGSGTRSICAC